MVENIYGRKTHPQLKQELNPFYRKASGEPPGLRTICELDDDLTLCNAVDTSLLSTQHMEIVNYGHKPRAISLPLPTVYRDGSYLRINVSETFNYDKPRRRRFSEPANPLSAATRPCGTFDGFVYDSCNFPRTPRISVNEEIVEPERNFDVQKRRHSDPLVYNAVTTKDGEHSQIKKEQNCTHNTVRSNVWVEKSQERQDFREIEEKSEQYPSARETRRRKSSLVPIPFGMKTAIHRKPNPGFVKRRFSFPLNKNEKDLTASLEEIESFFQSRQFDDDREVEQFNAPFDFVDVKLNDIKASNEELESPKSCEKIITQWMKFFG